MGTRLEAPPRRRYAVLPRGRCVHLLGPDKGGWNATLCGWAGARPIRNPSRFYDLCRNCEAREREAS